ncbi:hypothetical protein WR25_07680 [Diploscapter pachys]|uniref:tRNA (guanine-N(7)-)-methyltransferase non-catalytic subunit n=1 Tax=Diploscapter pachys TaxID=2018661 RepID=A0A2A2JPB2_9BILA|nr:hypothetical protein WR25_07680 [Diploscapter pachys]
MALLLPLDDKSGYVFCKQFGFFCKSLVQAATSDDDGIIDMKAITEAVPSDKEQQQNDNSREKIVFEALCCALSWRKEFVAVALSSKFIIVFRAADRTVIRAFRISRFPTVILFDKDDEHVIVSDRAGHVTRYLAMKSPEKVEQRREITGELTNYEGEPLSGTFSMILDLALSPDGRKLAMADRDEKIRVSRYPQCFVIENFCLGHTEFVSTMAVHENRLFSSGGDATIKEWDYQTGQLLRESAPLKLAAQKGVKPIRKIFLFSLNGKLHLAAFSYEMKTIFVVDEGNLATIAEIPLDDVPLHAAHFEGPIFQIIARSSIYRICCETRSVEKVETCAKLLELLKDAAEPMPITYKNVAYNNAEQYFERKRTKFEEIAKGDRTRKGKKKNSNGKQDAQGMDESAESVQT